MSNPGIYDIESKGLYGTYHMGCMAIGYERRQGIEERLEPGSKGLMKWRGTPESFAENIEEAGVHTWVKSQLRTFFA